MRIKCLNNARQLTLGIVSYSLDHNEQYPDAPAGINRWPWEVPWQFTDYLMTKEGVSRDVMYDPAFPQQNDDRFWNAATNQYRIIGYALTLPGTNSVVAATNQNPSFFSGPGGYGGVVADRDPEKRVLVAEPVISLSGQNDFKSALSYQWKNVPGGLPDGTDTPSGKWHGFSTSHFAKDGKLPLGGNVGMLDGHATWRLFDKMSPRTTGVDGTPIFWW